jgi:2-dehydro-3-deoxyphosphogalactonate aldolase
LPEGTEFWPVGGITPGTMAGWVRAGATGFGVGGQLYTPGVSAADIGVRAQEFVAAWRAIS